MPAGQRRFMFVVVCARWRWLDRVFKMEKKNGAKLRLLKTSNHSNS
ncbi:hypothetical protein T08_6798 [Trichinella sp. T8]|nr:hypothetical protein T08_6798 [Trichinella sp. T8]